MAPYCTVDQVRAIVDSDMSDDEILGLIAEVDAEMDLTLPTGGLTVIILQMISRRKTALDVFLKDPNSTGAGEYREDRGKTLEMLRQRIEKLEIAIDGGITFVVGYEGLDEILETE